MRNCLDSLCDKLPHLSGAWFATLGGLLGCIDAGIPSLIACAILGLFFGEIVGYIAVNLIVLLFGPKATTDQTHEGADNTHTETVVQCLSRYLSRTLGIVVLAVLLHECYWFVNMGLVTVNHNTGAYLTRATSRGDSRQRIRDDLKERRWQHDIFSARPLKWLIQAEAEALNQANLEFIEVINGKGIEKPRSGLKDTLKAKAIAALWRSDYSLVHMVTDPVLNAYGAALCELTTEQLEKYQSKGWVLRHLPKAWFQQ